MFCKCDILDLIGSSTTVLQNYLAGVNRKLSLAESLVQATKQLFTYLHVSYKGATQNLQKYIRQYLCLINPLRCVLVVCGECVKYEHINKGEKNSAAAPPNLKVKNGP